MGAKCKRDAENATQAQAWGSSEGNCATPRILFSCAAWVRRCCAGLEEPVPVCCPHCHASVSVACRLIPSMPLCVHPGLPWSSWARRRRPRSCTSPETLLRRGRRLPAARARRCDVYARPPSPRIQVSCARLHSVCFGDCTGVAPTIRKLCAAHIFRGFSVECMLQAERQILDIVNWDWASLKKQLPSAKVLGSLGNHDSGPSSCARRARPRHPPHKSTSMPMMSRGAVVLGCPCLC